MKARAGRSPPRTATGDPAVLCRVLTPTTIDGVARVAGELVELTEPQRGFLIDRRIVVALALPVRKRGDHGPAV